MSVCVCLYGVALTDEYAFVFVFVWRTNDEIISCNLSPGHSISYCVGDHRIMAHNNICYCISINIIIMIYETGRCFRLSGRMLALLLSLFVSTLLQLVQNTLSSQLPLHLVGVRPPHKKFLFSRVTFNKKELASPWKWKSSCCHPHCLRTLLSTESNGPHAVLEKSHRNISDMLLFWEPGYISLFILTTSSLCSVHPCLAGWHTSVASE